MPPRRRDVRVAASATGGEQEGSPLAQHASRLQNSLRRWLVARSGTASPSGGSQASAPNREERGPPSAAEVARGSQSLPTSPLDPRRRAQRARVTEQKSVASELRSVF